MASNKDSERDAPRTTMATKLVRLRSSNDTKSKLATYTNVEFVGKTKDMISIPAHPENALYQENYETWPSSSPTRLLFRFLGVNPASGETCHDFGHYNRVSCVDFTRRFNSVPVIFQITEQLSNVKTVNISLNSSNIVLPPKERILLNKPKKSYVSFTVRHLIIAVTKWKDGSVISSMSYHNLRLSVILEYAKLSWENIESIKIMTDERPSSTACDKILKSFREDLFAKFPNININFAPFAKKHLRSSGKKTNKGTSQESITTNKMGSEQTFHETNCHASPASNQSANGSVVSRPSSISSKSTLSLSPQEGTREFTPVQPISHKKCDIPVYTLDDDDDYDPEMEIEEINHSNLGLASDINDPGQDFSTNDNVQQQNLWRNHSPYYGGNGRHLLIQHSPQIGAPGSNPPPPGESRGGSEIWIDGYAMYSSNKKQ